MEESELSRKVSKWMRFQSDMWQLFEDGLFLCNLAKTLIRIPIFEWLFVDFCSRANLPRYIHIVEELYRSSLDVEGRLCNFL